MQTIEVTGENTPKMIESVIGEMKDGKRKEILDDIQKTMGVVPGFLKMLPHSHLEGAWSEFKEFQFAQDTAIEPKMRELIGLAVAGALKCQYCTYFHTVGAGMNGATAAEINEALLVAKDTAGWSSYLNGARYDMAQLKQELTTMKDHMAKQQRTARHS